MLFFEFRALIVLVGSLIGAWTDFRTGLIPDKITYSLIGLGIYLNVTEILVTRNWFASIKELFAVAVAVLILGYLLYYSGKLGGGDVKLFLGISLVLPFSGQQFFPLNVFLLQALFFSAIISVTFISVYFLVKYARKGIEWKENYAGIRNAVFSGIIFSLYFYFLFSFTSFPFRNYSFLLIPIFCALLFLAFEKGIKKAFFLKKVSLGKLEEDEVIATEFLDKKILKGLGLGFKGVIGEREIEKLRKLKVSKIPVYRDLPRFGPFIFLGVIIALIWPNALSFIFG